jgi:hypothetical protein
MVCHPGWVSDVVFLIGNGLSLGVSSAFSVGELTERLNAALDATTREALAEIAALGSPEPRAATQALGFEDLAGPVDRVAAAVRTLAPLARTVNETTVLGEAYEYLRRRYVQLVGIILSEITGSAHLAGRADWEGLNAFASALWDLQEQHETSVFTLSYDTLLESSLLETNRGWFYDGFAGMRLNHPLDKRTGTLAAYHLHGSALWYERSDGAILKTPSDSTLRDVLLEDWRTGNQSYGLPVVVLTDLKSRAIGQYPFDLLYQEFWSELVGATTLVAAGYGFRDVPVNRVIRSWLDALATASPTATAPFRPRSPRAAISPSRRPSPSTARQSRFLRRQARIRST